MKFTGLDALEEGFPTIELRSGEYRFDIHNTAELIRISLDFEGRRFAVEWRVQNVLESAHYGPYRVAHLTLAVSGLRGVCGFTDLVADVDDPSGIDFIEFIPQADRPALLRFVFSPEGEITVAGDECNLQYSGLK